MGHDYDPAKHSKERLGICGTVPVVPIMPVAAQVSVTTGMLHLKLLGESYVRGMLPSIPPSAWHATVTAIRTCEQEESYSGTGSRYFKLTVTPEPDGQSCRLLAGTVLVGRVAVYPESEIVSADQPLDEQMKEAGGGDTGVGH